MAGRPFRFLVLSTLVLAGNLGIARADKLPPPPDALKDYDSIGVIQILRPGDPAPHTVNGKEEFDPGFATQIFFRQTYVRPDRTLMVMNLFNNVQAKMMQGDVEWSYSPATQYVLQRTYKNVESLPQNPMSITPLSWSTYARLLQETDAGKLLPDENLDLVKPELAKKIEQLKNTREELKKSVKPADVARAQMVAAELARVHDDFEQLDLRKAHPCNLVEFPNAVFEKMLSAKGLMGSDSPALLDGGKTTVWITKQEGLPLKMEMAAKDGTVVLSINLRNVKINQGLHPSDVVLGNPPSARIFRAVADVRDKDFEAKLNSQLDQQVAQFEAEQKQASGPPPVVQPKKKKK